jgi:hypothetical protein
LIDKTEQIRWSKHALENLAAGDIVQVARQVDIGGLMGAVKIKGFQN